MELRINSVRIKHARSAPTLYFFLKTQCISNFMNNYRSQTKDTGRESFQSCLSFCSRGGCLSHVELGPTPRIFQTCSLEDPPSPPHLSLSNMGLANARAVGPLPEGFLVPTYNHDHDTVILLKPELLKEVMKIRVEFLCSESSIPLGRRSKTMMSYKRVASQF